MSEGVEIMGKEFMSVPEAAAALVISRQAVYKAIREDRMAASRMCGLLVVRRTEVQRYKEARDLRVLTGSPHG